jgi:hypothetical protein
LIFGSKTELAVATGASKSIEHFERRENVDAEQKLRLRRDPTVAIVMKAPSGDDAVHVRVEGELAGLGVKHGAPRGTSG